MPASKHDFTIERGASYALTLIYKDSSGSPIDLTGWCARLIWKTNKGVTQSFYTDNEDLENYKFIIIPNEGKLVLQFPAQVTNDFDFTSTKYDIELQAPTNIYTEGGKEVDRTLSGTILIVPRFSQSTTIIECPNG
jgi:hypothetical protein